MKTQKTKNTIRIVPEGELTVSNASELRDSLIRSMQEVDSVEIDFENVTEVDLSCLQLICSAHRSAEKKDKKIVLVHTQNESLATAVTQAGFNLYKNCSLNIHDDCLWAGGGEKWQNAS